MKYSPPSSSAPLFALIWHSHHHSHLSNRVDTRHLQLAAISMHITCIHGGTCHHCNAYQLYNQ
ncbi:hypothetical protein JG687_00002513 [Phytophthora cactorum]|uniref:Uncharacterized protein n=1 Tax=Phytophthora cactorum TaxID=29920 RepID=A0A8T1UU94_9STRA|nr:hypothetical protein JG687_00002513 [Phytophthora cactorum]